MNSSSLDPKMSPIPTPKQHGMTEFAVANASASAEIYAHGAHLAQWQPRGQQPVLWVSAQSQFEKGKAIRGGVPICFPWFGPKADDANAPMHGLARSLDWNLQSSQQTEAHSELIFVPSQDISAQANWPCDCDVQMKFSVGATLQIEFRVQNNGADTCEYEIALHTYFAVGDVRQIQIFGLEEVPFWDKVAQAAHEGEVDPIRIHGETDRVYQNTLSTCTLSDALWKREITVAKSGSKTTVVWNPWRDKAAKMPDFGDDEWSQMVCIETANVGENRVRLQPNSQHITRARIDVRSW